MKENLRASSDEAVPATYGAGYFTAYSDDEHGADDPHMPVRINVTHEHVRAAAAERLSFALLRQRAFKGLWSNKCHFISVIVFIIAGVVLG